MCWAHCPAWCNIMGWTLLWASGRGDFFLGVNKGSDSIPWNSFCWEYKPRSSLCTHAFHRRDSKDPDIHVLYWWMPVIKTNPACTTHEHRVWLPLWLDENNVRYQKNLSLKVVNPQRYSWECSRNMNESCAKQLYIMSWKNSITVNFKWVEVMFFHQLKQ